MEKQGKPFFSYLLCSERQNDIYLETVEEKQDMQFAKSTLQVFMIDILSVISDKNGFTMLEMK